jgi:hypothetical protein
MKKNQQLAQLLLEIHEQWARDNGYRKIRKALDKAQASGFKHQASSNKLQAPSFSNNKRQASRFKLQAASIKLLNHGPWKKFHGPLTEVLD